MRKLPFIAAAAVLAAAPVGPAFAQYYDDDRYEDSQEYREELSDAQRDYYEDRYDADDSEDLRDAQRDYYEDRQDAREDYREERYDDRYDDRYNDYYGYDYRPRRYYGYRYRPRRLRPYGW